MINTTALIRILISFSLILCLTFFISCEEKLVPNESSTYNLTIEKDEEGVWRVLDNEGNNRGILSVNRKDTINWQFTTSNAQMAFYKDLNKYFEFEEGLFQDNARDVVRRFDESERPLRQIFQKSRSQFIEREGTIRLTVKDDAPQDTLVYQIYIPGEDTLVVGDSPPMLDIQDYQ